MLRKDDWIMEMYIEQFLKNQDYYTEGQNVVMTEKHHLKRGHCCGSGCRHCPYIPKHTKGSSETK